MTGLDGKTYFVGIGAQKAGTSWLNDYLKSRGDVYLPNIKELHYFDRLYGVDESGGLPDRFETQLRELLPLDAAEMPLRRRERVAELIDRVKMNLGPQHYREFFEHQVPHDTRVYGEITPSYSVLPEEGFRQIDTLFPGAKFIFLLRDPVERYYSALRMRQGRRQNFSAKAHFAKGLNKSLFVMRTRYDLTLNNLYNAVDHNNVFVGFYETLFTPEEVRRLGDFLGLPYREADFGKVKNKSPDAGPLSEEEIDMAREAFADVYDYCAKAFGDRLPAAWKTSKIRQES